MNTQKTVIVGLSGGVDSSVAAYLLKQQGYNVLGVTLQIWSSEQIDDRVGGCCSLSAINDAARVAEQLDIPFYVLNFRDLFEEEVVDYFIKEYLLGRTPNPCIVCNKKIKFGSFLKKAKALGADFVATGHYGRIEYNQEKQRYLLKKARDTTKDRTYALYNFTQEQLAHTLLPLGDYTKQEIRALANRLELKVADKPDSQEICFIPDDNYQQFLKLRVGQDKFKPGPFLNMEGKVLGTHQGLPFYTIGQRKGLGLALGYPVYVIALDYEKNAVIVGNDGQVYKKNLIAVENNYILIDKLEKALPVTAKIRYAAPAASAKLIPLANNKVQLTFAEPERAITPGQAVVYYQGDYVLGGGTIEQSF